MLLWKLEVLHLLPPTRKKRPVYFERNMKCTACPYTGPALATTDLSGKPLNVCPECSTPLNPPVKTWEILGIPKVRYLATQPWKAAKMERKAFEAVLIHISPEAVDALKRDAEAEALLKALGIQQGFE